MIPSETDGLEDNMVSVTDNTGSSDSTSENKSSIYALATHSQPTPYSKEDAVYAAVDKENKSNLSLIYRATNTFERSLLFKSTNLKVLEYNIYIIKRTRTWSDLVLRQ